MYISRKTDYALIILAELVGRTTWCPFARRREERRSVLVCPLHPARPCVGRPHREQPRRAHGGMRLCVDPHDVTMRQVIEAIQGPVYVSTCGTAGPDGEPCPFRPECHFNPVWCEAERILARYFDSVTLYQVVCEHQHPMLTDGSGFELTGPTPRVPTSPAQGSRMRAQAAASRAHRRARPRCPRGFRAKVLDRGRELYRDLPWRRTRDPYRIWISEVMLQQTQVSRVDGRWQRWCERFPSVDALAAAAPADVLEVAGHWATTAVPWPVACGRHRERRGWHHAARAGGPGGAAGRWARPRRRASAPSRTTCPASIWRPTCAPSSCTRSFRAARGVGDRELVPLVAAACRRTRATRRMTRGRGTTHFSTMARTSRKPCPTRRARSKAHARRTRFEGSHRQKRADRAPAAGPPRGPTAWCRHRDTCRRDV